MKLRVYVLVVAALLSSCSSPNPDLWRARPAEIVVKEEMVVPGDLIGTMKIYVPAGLYRFTRSNDLGFVYECEGAVARAVDGGFGIKQASRAFQPAIVLYNRSDEILVMQIAHSPEEIGPKGGEIGEIVIRRAIQRDGYILVPRSRGLSPQQRAELGFPPKLR